MDTLEKQIHNILFYLVPYSQRHGKEFIISQSNNYTYLTRRFGNTNYRIKVFLSENATETFEDKVLRLVRNDSSLSCVEREKHEEENHSDTVSAHNRPL